MRNPGAFLRPAIASVLGQSYQDLELLVVDDGCKDGSRDYVESLHDSRVRVLEGPRSGIAACMNVALASARGEIIMRCDADDLFPADRVRVQVQWLTEHADHGAVCGRFTMIDHNDEVVSPLGPWPNHTVDNIAPQLLCREFSTTLCSFAIRRRAALATGGFRTYFKTAEDTDFVLRLAEAERIGYLPAVTYLYRLHGESITHTQPSDTREFYERAAFAMSSERMTGGSDSLMAEMSPCTPSVATCSTAPPYSAAVHISDLRTALAWKRLGQRDGPGARSLAWLALRGDPKSVRRWKAFALISARSWTMEWTGENR